MLQQGVGIYIATSEDAVCGTSLENEPRNITLPSSVEQHTDDSFLLPPSSSSSSSFIPASTEATTPMKILPYTQETKASRPFPIIRPLSMSTSKVITDVFIRLVLMTSTKFRFFFCLRKARCG